MFKRSIFLIVIVILLGFQSQAQMQTGGNVGVNINNNILTVDFAPEFSYSFIENTAMGISPFVIYSNDLQTSISEFLVGGRVFCEYKTDFGVFAHAEFEATKPYTTEGYQKTIYAAPLGGGFESELSKNTVAYIMVLCDMLYKKDISLRQNPIVRAGIRYSIN